MGEVLGIGFTTILIVVDPEQPFGSLYVYVTV
jgi:hypothetical protein